MNRDGPPSLLVTMNGLDRSPKQLPHLLLGFVQPLSDGHKLPGIHDPPQKKIKQLDLNTAAWHT